MRVRGRRLPTHPEDLIQWILTVQPALMKQTGLQDASIPENVKGIKNLTHKLFKTPYGDAWINIKKKQFQRGSKHLIMIW